MEGLKSSFEKRQDSKCENLGSLLEELRRLKQLQRDFELKGKYVKADKVHKKIEKMLEIEQSARKQLISERHVCERFAMLQAHNKQVLDFNSEWDKFFDKFDEQTKDYIKDMIESHANELQNYQEQLQQEILSKPPRWSRELIQWRKRQQILADQKYYAQAQQIKVISDSLEEEERGSMNSNFSDSCDRKEANLRRRQETELQGFQSKIEIKRRTMEAQRKHDCKRLLKRNENLRKDLEKKQVSFEMLEALWNIYFI